ncbi:MAG: CHAT domain-containing protein, partial [Candidatus Eremiobacteraeota bacterium]|nr:CHAT domain-containing protein [Candidatus Eremiobacteraeota bacterium]
ATAMLMARFYERLRPDAERGTIEPPAALAEAQRWLRDTTNAEKTAYFASFLPEISQEPSRIGRMSEDGAGEYYRALAFESPDERAHAHPFYWAAFSYVGV